MTSETPDSVDLFVINAINTFNAAELDELIYALGHRREQMTTAIGTTPPLDRSAPLRAPQWRVQANAPDRHHVMLHVRDPRYGWLQYVYPAREARKMGEQLVASAGQPNP